MLTAKELLNENVYVVNVGLHSKTGKNSTPTPAHQDNFYWSRKPANALTAYVALTKQSKKNGVISYLLGSHKHGVLKHKKSNIIFYCNNMFYTIISFSGGSFIKL